MQHEDDSVGADTDNILNRDVTKIYNFPHSKCILNIHAIL